MDSPPKSNSEQKIVPNLSPETKIHLNGSQDGTEQLKKTLEELLKGSDGTPQLNKGLSKSININRSASTPSTQVFDIRKRPLFIGVTGGTAGGKTSICDM